MCLSFLSPITIQATSAVEFESSHSIVKIFPETEPFTAFQSDSFEVKQ